MYRRATEQDRNPRIANTLRQEMRNAGLANVEETYVALPIGTWPTEPRERRIGEKNLANIDRLLESFGLLLFIRRCGLTKDQVLQLNSRARQEARNLRLRLYLPLFVQ